MTRYRIRQLVGIGNVSAMPASTTIDAMTSRIVTPPERNHTPPAAAITGTASCTVPATVALSVFKARNQIA